jgi:hypothetical protein
MSKLEIWWSNTFGLNRVASKWYTAVIALIGNHWWLEWLIQRPSFARLVPTKCSNAAVKWRKGDRPFILYLPYLRSFLSNPGMRLSRSGHLICISYVLLRTYVWSPLSPAWTSLRRVMYLTLKERQLDADRWICGSEANVPIRSIQPRGGTWNTWMEFDLQPPVVWPEARQISSQHKVSASFGNKKYS